MAIIVDTHIWYQLGGNEELFDRVKDEPLHPTFSNIYELCKTENVVDKTEYTRNAMRRIFHYEENAILEPPFIYLALLNNDFDYDTENEISYWLDFSSKIAKGYQLHSSVIDEFKEIHKGIIKDYQAGADYFNESAKKNKRKIKTNKTQHWKKDRTNDVIEFFDYCVRSGTQNEYNLENMNPQKICCAIKSFERFIKEVEIGHRDFQARDWIDLTILLYVYPGDKFWTEETKWINIIKEAGMADYLYEPPT